VLYLLLYDKNAVLKKCTNFVKDGILAGVLFDRYFEFDLLYGSQTEYNYSFKDTFDSLKWKSINSIAPST
jgi:hypothetical protein